MFRGCDHLWRAWRSSATQTPGETTVVGLEMKPVGEPYAGNPHVRGDRADLRGRSGTECLWLSAEAERGQCYCSSARIAPPRLESVSELDQGLQSFRSMRRIEASFKNARALRLRFSQSLARRRQRLSQAMVRSTIQRLGNCTNPLA